MSRYALAGYTDRPNYRPGDKVDFHLSSDQDMIAEATVVRLIHGDPNPDGPGFKQHVVADVVDALALTSQHSHPGTHVRVGPSSKWSSENQLTVHTFVWPTIIGDPEPQVLISSWDPVAGDGWSLELIDGSLAARIGTTEGEFVVTSTGRLFSHTWYAASLVIDWTAGTANLEQRLVVHSQNGRFSPIVDLDRHHAAGGTFLGRLDPAADHHVIIGARAGQACGSATCPGATENHFNGKLAAPSIYAGVATAEDLALLSDGRIPALTRLAEWDFSAGTTRQGFADDSLVQEVSGAGMHGRTVNYPDRAMTGWNWSGDEENYAHAPEEYGAIWFHADSLEDCQWEPTVTWTVPDDLHSGCYALWVRGDGREDHVPFFVAAPRGAVGGIAVLIPTYSYVAYANTAVMQHIGSVQTVMGIIATLDDIDLHIHEHLGDYGMSLYTYSRDGKGTQFSSWRRPIMDMRPRHRHEYGSNWQFPADLYLIDWLAQQGFEHDVITDHDLQAEGADLLRQYNVVLTGTHPEYASREMLDAWEQYLGNGGRGMYMGGNGFYWVTTPHPQKPWLIEMRRGETGDQGWRAAPGELYHQISGERGGLWRMRGRAPQKLWGVGYGAHGLDRSAPYVQMPDATDPRWSFLLDGVAPGELIGDFGLTTGGAAGLEFDRVDSRLGTPPNTALLACSVGHSRNAVIAIEDVFLARDGMDGLESSLVRADLTFFTTKNGGAVFSTGSMAWCGSLSHNDYDNNVSTITRNVLRLFAADGPVTPVD